MKLSAIAKRLRSFKKVITGRCKTIFLEGMSNSSIGMQKIRKIITSATSEDKMKLLWCSVWSEAHGIERQTWMKAGEAAREKV